MSRPLYEVLAGYKPVERSLVGASTNLDKQARQRASSSKSKLVTTIIALSGLTALSLAGAGTSTGKHQDIHLGPSKPSLPPGVTRALYGPTAQSAAGAGMIMENQALRRGCSWTSTPASTTHAE